MKVSVPAVAPGTPPETGASRKPKPAVSTSSCRALASSIAIVELSTTRLPGGSTGIASSSTARTCEPS